MGVYSFYKMRQPRQFEHKPIYHDPRKEALQKRIHKVKMELGVEEPNFEQYKEAIKGSFIEGTTHLRKSRDKGDNVRNRGLKTQRLLLILVILAFIFWYFFWK
jgi:hypothetical protein